MRQFFPQNQISVVNSANFLVVFLNQFLYEGKTGSVLQLVTKCCINTFLTHYLLTTRDVPQEQTFLLLSYIFSDETLSSVAKLCMCMHVVLF